MRDYQTKQNVGAVPDSNSSTKLGASEATSMREESKNAVTPAGLTLAPQDGAGEDVTQLAQSLFIHAVKSLHFVDGGAVNAIELTPVSGASGVTLPPVSDSYANLDGAHFTFDAAFTNTITAVTISIGQTAGTQYSTKVLRREDGSALSVGDISTSVENEIRLNLGSNRFELIRGSGAGSGVKSVNSGNATNIDNSDPANPIVNVDDATTSQKGVAEIATDAQVIAGSGTNLIVTPAALEQRVATTTNSGLIEIAQDGEIIVGTNTTDAVTPFSLTLRTSTTSRTGLTEKSTSVENVGGVAADKYPDVVGVKEMIDTHAATLDDVYPIGTIYMNSATANNPGTGSLLGFGTWIPVSEGRVLMGVGVGPHTVLLGDTGGAIDVTLMVANLASHSHSFSMFEDGGNDQPGPERGSLPTSGLGVTNTTGSATPFSILNPFIGVAMWERIA